MGSDNATEPFPGRDAADDSEVARRTAAALAWLDGTFSVARVEGLQGVVLAIHGDPGFEGSPPSPTVRPGYEAFVDRLAALVKDFSGPVLLIHGDSHIQRVDHPLTDGTTGQPLPNFTRLETFGSPDIGWIRVVIDSAAGRVISYEPRRQPGWRLW